DALHGDRFRKDSRCFDFINNVSYDTSVEGGQCVLTATAGQRKAKVTAQFAFGSGSRGVTYVGSYLQQPVELRISHYSRAGRQGRWEFTPGQPLGARPQTPVGRVLGIEDQKECFLCHSTALVMDQTGVDTDHSILGIGCETCHGPGRAHVEAVRRKDPELHIPRLSRMREQLSTRLCGQCHRNPESKDADQPITLAQLPRFQGLALSKSACFRKSAGRLSCVTCHDPHRNAATITRAEYNGKCVSCHTPHRADQVACKVSTGGDCVSCHMPAQTVDLPTRPSFNTHWIKVWRKNGKDGKDGKAEALRAALQSAAG
ncbi:MAG TPA: multiheme c-type cytochrome, partial [Armatimonadota bacterium]|nr:multiheme c-type cytochrome [Armatimonadota bacterium]